MTLARKSISELLRLYGEILQELRDRRIVRSANSPVGDYTEWLVTTRLGLKLTNNSQSGHDAVDVATGKRFQIKGRCVVDIARPAQLGVIRNLERKDFDFLIAVIFDRKFEVAYAAKIPHALVPTISFYQRHVNGHITRLRRGVCDQPGVEDLTDVFKSNP